MARYLGPRPGAGQIASNHSASFFIVDELMRAAGIPTTDQRLVVMPYDPLLGAGGELHAGPARVSTGIDTRSFGFRKNPLGSRHIVRAAWAFAGRCGAARAHALG